MTDAPKAGGPLTGKIGGQPAWLWIVGVVVLAIGVQWYRQRSAATQAAAQAAPAQAVDPSVMGTGTLPAGSGAPVAQPGPTMTTDQWLAAAMKAAKDAGEDPIHAASALNRFVNGGDLSYADTLVVNAALDAVGEPPGFSAVPPGSWASRPLPTAGGGGGFPAGGDVTVSRLIQPANQPGIFAEYSDGSVKWITNPQELQGIQASNPNLSTIVQLPVSDPVFQRATFGTGGITQYQAQGGGRPYNAPDPGHPITTAVG